MATSFSIEEYRGDTIKLDLAFTRGGVPVDMTGGNAWFTARTSKTSADAPVIERNTINGGISWLDQAQGTARLVIRPQDTEAIAMTSESVSFDCDIQIQEANADVETVGEGTLKLKIDVTRTRL